MEKQANAEREILEESWTALEGKVRERRWQGHDPDDALRSPLLGRLPGKPLRRGVLRLIGNLPFNPRAALLYGPAADSKSLSLFMRGYLRRAATVGGRKGRSMGRRAERLFGMLKAQAIGGESGPLAWGYPFPWQGRQARVAAGEPHSICAAFAGEALLDLAEWRVPDGAPPLPHPTLLGLNLPGAKDARTEAWKMAWRTGVHALRLHPRTRSEDGAVFHCAPADRALVVHTSLPLAAFLARLGRAAARREGESLLAECEELSIQTDDVEVRHRLSRPWVGGSLASECWEASAEAALFAAKKCVGGAWPVPDFGKRRGRPDVAKSFHAAENLLSLKQIRGELWESRELAEDLDGWSGSKRLKEFFSRLDRTLEEGWRDYKQRFLLPGEPALYDEEGRGPFDSHAVARAALALGGFGEVAAGREQIIRLIAQMQDPREGLFYYRRTRRGKLNKVEYMRWTQAWVFWAMSGLLAFTDAEASDQPALVSGNGSA